MGDFAGLDEFDAAAGVFSKLRALIFEDRFVVVNERAVPGRFANDTPLAKTRTAETVSSRSVIAKDKGIGASKLYTAPEAGDVTDTTGGKFVFDSIMPNSAQSNPPSFQPPSLPGPEEGVE